MSWTDEVAIVTGGASGIGCALSTELARRGAFVVLADRQVELAREVVKAIEHEGGRGEAAELDVRDADRWQHVVTDTIARHGRVDALFNNAGIGVAGEMTHYSRADWDDVIDVNLRGVAYGVHAVYPHMVQRRSGRIVNTSSVAGLVPAAGEGSYTAAKHGVVGLTKSLRVEAKHHGVRVSALCPGAIRTPILRGGRYGRVNYEGVDMAFVDRLWERVRPMAADVFAKKALAAIEKDVAVIVIPSWWKPLWYLDRLSPELSVRLWQMAVSRLRLDLERAGMRPIPVDRRSDVK